MMANKTVAYGLSLTIGLVFFVGLAGAGPPMVPPESPTSLIPPWFAFSIGTKLHDLFEYLAFVTQPADAYVISLATSHWNSEVAYALTKTKILDCVQDETAFGDSTISCESVAAKLDLDSFVVCRYMESGRYLHLLQKDTTSNEFSITTHGALLTEKGGFHDFMFMINEENKESWRPVATELMKDGGKPGRNSGFEIAHGMDGWTYFANHPEKEAQFDRAMKALNPPSTGAVLMDWTPPSEDVTFCDIGGGVGSLVGDILTHYPKMSAIVLERPEVAARARVHLESIGLSDRAKAVDGDFFEEFPEELVECDVFHLRGVVHALDDESNIRILENIRDIAEKSTKNGKKVVVVQDHITDTGAPFFFEKAKSMMTINMIANCPYGARERSVSEHADLFRAAGYESDPTFVPMRAIMSMVEVEL